jgi:hypothetical protein
MASGAEMNDPQDENSQPRSLNVQNLGYAGL